MPMLIWTISDYFFHKKRDLYFIQFNDLSEEERENDENIIAKQELLSWFEQYLPEVEIKPIFPFTVESGILSGRYDGSISIDFDDESLSVFCEKWEDKSGKSLDSRFQCYYIPLEEYKSHYQGEIPDPNKYYDQWFE